MSADRIIVVGAVVVSSGRILAARRVGPAELAGLWEFPGGKVEPGEEPREALRREVQEELNVTISVVEEISGGAGPWLISNKYALRLFRATVIEGHLRPGADHDELRWLSAAQLESVSWLPSDLAALGAVRRAVWGE